MFIPNRFNGYQSDGRRILPVGGGVGEAMLIGAAMGGGSAALTGGDPLKGAVIGGLTGGVGAGVGGAIGGATAGTTAATTGAATGAGTVAGTAALPAGQSFAEASRMAMLNQVPPISGLPLSSIADQAIFAPLQATASAPTASALAPTGFTPAVAEAATPLSSFQQAMQAPGAYIAGNPFKMGAAALAGAVGSRRPMEGGEEEYSGPLRRFRYDPDIYRPRFAEGGIASLTNFPVERMSERNEARTMMANRGQMYAGGGGISSLGSYSDGGRMLKGPGDGMSDSIPASISNKRPARLADGEFVVPADVVSGIGNGSTDAGARQLYAMMDKVRQKRTGTKKQGREINPRSVMPA